MKNKKVMVSFLAMGLTWLLGSVAVSACVGARPLGMGGAFIAVADGVEAVYWNPAGLTQVMEEVVHYTITLTPQDQMGYRSFWGINKNLGRTSMGFSYISRLRTWDVLEEWYVLSAATKATPDVSLGVNWRYETHSDGSTGQQIDVGGLWSVNDRLKVGFLLQTLNNFRPGLSYQLTDAVTVSVDLYNALHHPQILNGESRVMWGLEANKGDWSLRTGAYAGDWTMGIGYKGFDLTFMDRDTAIILAGFTTAY